MKNNPKKVIIFVSIMLFLHGCATDPGVRIDQVPLYGGIDRSMDPRLAEGDQIFIDQVINEYGTKRKASEKLVDNGFIFYHGNNMSNAMKRFNQAWLVDDSNPEAYHGFASVLLNQEKDCEALKMMNKAVSLDWGDRWINRAGFYTDFGFVTAMCAGYGLGISAAEKQTMAVQSEQWFIKAKADILVRTVFI